MRHGENPETPSVSRDSHPSLAGVSPDTQEGQGFGAPGVSRCLTSLTVSRTYRQERETRHGEEGMNREETGATLRALARGVNEPPGDLEVKP